MAKPPTPCAAAPLLQGALQSLYKGSLTSCFRYDVTRGRRGADRVAQGPSAARPGCVHGEAVQLCRRQRHQAADVSAILFPAISRQPTAPLSPILVWPLRIRPLDFAPPSTQGARSSLRCVCSRQGAAVVFLPHARESLLLSLLGRAARGLPALRTNRPWLNVNHLQHLARRLPAVLRGALKRAGANNRDLRCFSRSALPRDSSAINP